MAKKISCLAVALILLFSLAACGDDVKRQLQELQQQIERQDDKIAELENRIAELENDFRLTIFVEEPELQVGETFKVNIYLKNQSERDQEIAAFLLFSWDIPDWSYELDVDISENPSFILLESNHSYIPEAPMLIDIDEGYEEFGYAGQAAGDYDLKVCADFYINYGQKNQQNIKIWSNTIKLTVLEKSS